MAVEAAQKPLTLSECCAGLFCDNCAVPCRAVPCPCSLRGSLDLLVPSEPSMQVRGSCADPGRPWEGRGGEGRGQQDEGLGFGGAGTSTPRPGIW